MARSDHEVSFDAAMRSWGQPLARSADQPPDSADTDPLEFLANEVAIRFNAPVDAMRRSLERLRQGLSILDPGLAARDEALWIDTAVSVLSGAIEALGWEQAVFWIESDDPAILLNRCLVTEFLAQRGGNHRVLLFSRAELADRLESLKLYLEAERQPLLQTGLPSHSFEASEGLFWWLCRLYPTRRTMFPWPSMAHADIPETGWARLEEAPIGPRRVACSLAEADLIHGLTETDATRLESLRPIVLNLKLEILQAAVRQLRQPFPQELWSGCLASIVETLSIEDAEFLLRIDRGLNASSASSSELDPMAWSLSGDDGPFPPGGLTNLFELVGHVEKEFTVTTMGRTRDALGELVVNKHGDHLLKVSRRRPGYFGFVGRRSRERIDRAIDIFCECDDQEVEFWRSFQTRLSAALANDLGQRVAVEFLVSPRHAAEVQLNVATYVEWLLQHLRQGGSVPGLSLELQTGVPPTLPAGQPPPLLPPDNGECVLRKRPRNWIFRFLGSEEMLLPDMDGFLYLQHILTRPHVSHDPVELYGLKTLKYASDRRATTPARSSYSSNEATSDDNSDAARPEASNEEALRAHRIRLHEIELEIEEARRNNDLAMLDRLADEKTGIQRQLQADSYKGKIKQIGTGNRKKAMDRVRAAIKTAISKIAEQSPSLGSHLVDYFKIDILYYSPPHPVRWTT